MFICRRKLLYFRFLLAVFFIAWSNFALSQAYIAQRKTINYEKRQYNAGTQNWKIRQDAQKRIYFANNEGVLVLMAPPGSFSRFPIAPLYARWSLAAIRNCM
jgi:hypothetical protein